jgi:threonine dehydrogenase-like Zn-dependent dehydrogenase
VPGLGQVSVAVRACGICGSDLHVARHGREMLRLAGEMTGLPELGTPAVDLDRDVFMGHEFSAEVLEAGPDTVAPASGTIVTSIPAMVTATGVQDLVYTNDLPSGYGDEVDAAPMVTGRVDLDGVPGAFRELSDPQHQCKVLVVPEGVA